MHDPLGLHATAENRINASPNADRELGRGTVGPAWASGHHCPDEQLFWVTFMEADMLCPTPGCETVIRKTLGLHGFGEPNVWKDDEGYFVQCPKCRRRIPWPPPVLEPDGYIT
jgi:hypothetical protein